MPGFVDGKVTDILTSGKKVDGKDVKASKEVSLRPALTVVSTRSNTSNRIRKLSWRVIAPAKCVFISRMLAFTIDVGLGE